MINDNLKTILNEMQTYNPNADEYEGKFIIPGWTDRIERALTIELPEVFEIEMGAYSTVKVVSVPELLEVLTAAGLTVKSE